MKKKAQYNREYNPACEMWGIAQAELYLCEHDESEMNSHHCLVGLLFAAFAYV